MPTRVSKVGPPGDARSAFTVATVTRNRARSLSPLLLHERSLSQRSPHGCLGSAPWSWAPALDEGGGGAYGNMWWPGAAPWSWPPELREEGGGASGVGAIGGRWTLVAVRVS
jgi:hypothetical protein